MRHAFCRRCDKEHVNKWGNDPVCDIKRNVPLPPRRPALPLLCADQLPRVRRGTARAHRGAFAARPGRSSRALPPPPRDFTRVVAESTRQQPDLPHLLRFERSLARVRARRRDPLASRVELVREERRRVCDVDRSPSSTAPNSPPPLPLAPRGAPPPFVLFVAISFARRARRRSRACRTMRAGSTRRACSRSTTRSARSSARSRRSTCGSAPFCSSRRTTARCP